MDMELELTLEPELEKNSALVVAEEPPKPQVAEPVLSE